MNSIMTPSLLSKKRYLLISVLFCCLTFTSVALGGFPLIRFVWKPGFHPWSNSPTSSVLEAEWIVYPNGLETGSPVGPHNFYLTTTNPHCVQGGEILFHYGTGFAPTFVIYDCNGSVEPCPPTQYTALNSPSLQPYIGTREINEQSFNVLRYRLSYKRTAGPVMTKLLCTEFNGAIAVASHGQTLPQETIYVTSTVAFPPSGQLRIETLEGFTIVDYAEVSTGTSLNTIRFDGCTGGTGTLQTGGLVYALSPNETTATHFRNTVHLFNYGTQKWDEWYDHEFDRAIIHDCTSCNIQCAEWGPMFEANDHGPNGLPCPQADPLPPIGVTDMLMKIGDNGRWVRGNTSNTIYEPYNLNACNQNPPYEVWSYLENYRWIIRSVP